MLLLPSISNVTIPHMAKLCANCITYNFNDKMYLGVNHLFCHIITLPFFTSVGKYLKFWGRFF